MQLDVWLSVFPFRLSSLGRKKFNSEKEASRAKGKPTCLDIRS